MSNSDPNEASRKTLDEIRREIDAEFGFPKVGDPGFEAGREESDDRRADDTRRGSRLAEHSSEPDARAVDARLAHLREFSERRRQRAPRVDHRRVAEEWTERHEPEEDAVDARLARFREISARRHVALGRHGEGIERRGRRSGYLLAALVGCLVGQALLFIVLILTNYGVRWQVSGVRPTTLTANDVAVAPPPPTPSRPASETRQQADEPPAEPSSPPPPSPPSVDLPARVVPEPATSSVRQPATIASATVRESDQPRVTAPSRPARPRPPAGPRDVAESQAQVRAAFKEWLRTSSARGGASVQTTEPVIVLSPDGRTAKTYVSVMSPIGLIPRQQRWELGPRGWDLIEDRQAGLPAPGTAPSARNR